MRLPALAALVLGLAAHPGGTSAATDQAMPATRSDCPTRSVSAAGAAPPSGASKEKT